MVRKVMREQGAEIFLPAIVLKVAYKIRKEKKKKRERENKNPQLPRA